MGTNKKTARIAGVMFLMMVIFGLIAEIFFREKIFDSNDITVTAEKILSNVLLYRVGITCDLLMALFYLFTALTLYQLLRSVNQDLAAVMVVFAAAGSIMLLFNTLIEISPLSILSGNDYTNTFDSSQIQSLAMFFYNLYQHGYMIGQIFFALWVLPLGLLIMKSGFIPKVCGILFVIETIFGSMSVAVHFLIPNGTAETILLLPGVIAEFTFMLWLLIRGIRSNDFFSAKI
jgi:hypothetical protein